MSELRDEAPAGATSSRSPPRHPRRPVEPAIRSHPLHDGWRSSSHWSPWSPSALLATATLVFANNDVTTLSGRQRTDLGHAVASAVKVSYEQGHTWDAADLSPALALASQAGIAVAGARPIGRAGGLCDPRGEFARARSGLRS